MSENKRKVSDRTRKQMVGSENGQGKVNVRIRAWIW